MNRCNFVCFVRSGFLIVFGAGLIACGSAGAGQAHQESASNGGAGTSATRERGCDEGPPTDSSPQELLTFASAPDGAKGKVRIFAISKAHAERLPQWSPGQGEPPLGVSRAYRKASEGAQKVLGGELGNYRLHRIQFINDGGGGGGRGTWFYIFRFMEMTESMPSEPRQVMGEIRRVVVLMDGCVLPGRVVKEERMVEIIRSGGSGDCKE